MSKPSIAILFLLAVAVTVAIFLLVNRPRRVTIDAPVAADFPETGFSHVAFDKLLRQYASADGKVDYARWLASRESMSALESYLAAVSRFSPDKTPGRFPERND